MHAMTLRLPEPVYQAAKQLASRQGISINGLIQQAITEKARRSTESRLRASYETISSDAAEVDVEGSLAVQVEALLDD